MSYVIVHRRPRRGGWMIRNHRTIVRSEPYVSADLGAPSDVTAKSMRSEAAPVSPAPAISSFPRLAGSTRWFGRRRALKCSRQADSGRGTIPTAAGALRVERGRGRGSYALRVTLRRETGKENERPC